MDTVEHVLAAHNELGEGPVWSVEEQALYWLDVSCGTYARLRPTTGEYECIPVGSAIGVLALCASGDLLLATREGIGLWNEARRSLRPIAHPEQGKPHMLYNEGAVDCMGRFWVGSMNQDEEAAPEGTLYRLDPDGSVHAMLAPVGIPNGIGWSPDNTRMYITDSALRTIYTFDFDAATGTISNSCIFVHGPDDSALPDGLTVDCEGCVWSAHWAGAKVVCYDPQGQIERVITLPALHPTSCVFGGANIDELYITSAWMGHTPEQQALYPLSGDLFRVKIGTRGLPKFKFAG
jgi:sugar lactone lactonase YvrE